MAGETFGKYVVIKRLALGGMAEVFLARLQGPAGFNKLVVLKQVLPDLAENHEFVEMFLDEGRLAARLTHPNIAQTFELGVEAGRYFMAMEFVPGEPLFQVLKRARDLPLPTPAGCALRITMQLLEALDYAHAVRDERGNSLNLVHRDVTPSNVMVTFHGGVKLLDFGIARAVNQTHRTEAGRVKGKGGYMSPEACRGAPLDGRSDLYAVGSILYQLVTGVRPFESLSSGHDILALINATMEGSFAPPSTVRDDVSPELERIIMKAMAVDKNERYPTAGDMLDDLEKYAAAAHLFAGPRELTEHMKRLFPDAVELEQSSELAAAAAPGDGPSFGLGPTHVRVPTTEEPSSFGTERAVPVAMPEVAAPSVIPRTSQVAKLPRGSQAGVPGPAAKIPPRSQAGVKSPVLPVTSADEGWSIVKSLPMSTELVASPNAAPRPTPPPSLGVDRNQKTETMRSPAPRPALPWESQPGVSLGDGEDQATQQAPMLSASGPLVDASDVVRSRPAIDSGVVATVVVHSSMRLDATAAATAMVPAANARPGETVADEDAPMPTVVAPMPTRPRITIGERPDDEHVPQPTVVARAPTGPGETAAAEEEPMATRVGPVPLPASLSRRDAVTAPSVATIDEGPGGIKPIHVVSVVGSLCLILVGMLLGWSARNDDPQEQPPMAPQPRKVVAAPTPTPRPVPVPVPAAEKKVVAVPTPIVEEPSVAADEAPKAVARPRKKVALTADSSNVGKGTLKLDAYPWARVSERGKEIGVTPLKLELSAGEHQFVLENAVLKVRRVVKLTIKSKQQLEHVEKLAP